MKSKSFAVKIMLIHCTILDLLVNGAGLFKDRRQILYLISSEFERINQLLIPLKSSESLWFSDEFRGIRS